MAEPRRRYQLSGGRLHLRLSADEREQLERFSDQEQLPLSRAALRLMRLGLQPRSSAPEPTGGVDTSATYELAVHNLIACEQIIKLLEGILRHQPGAADELLFNAGKAAQRRLSRGLLASR